MKNKMLLKICTLFMICVCSMAVVYGYNNNVGLTVESSEKNEIYFIRESIADPETVKKYLEATNGNLNKWIESVEFDLPTSSTYEVAYYMFSKENVLQVGGDEAASIYGYVNGYIVDDTGLNVSYGEYKQNVKFICWSKNR